MAKDPEFLLLGEVLRPHGIRGELRVKLFTDHPEHLSELTHVYLGRSTEDPQPRSYPLEAIRLHQQYGLLKLKGYDDRTTADKLRGLIVMVRLEDAVPLGEDEFYLYQLIGLTVRTVDGETLGTLADVIVTGANDVYQVDSPTYGEVLIPAIRDTIVDIDIDQGVILVKLLDGLLPDPK